MAARMLEVSMWDSKYLDELDARHKAAQEGGGKARAERQHAKGKLTARERIEALFDDNTFVEINDLVLSRATEFGMDGKRRPGDGVVTGWGKIHGRTAFVASQDFTVIGGSLGEAQAQRICHAMDMAYESRVPFISINDSGGARIEEGMVGLSGYADIFYRNTRASGVIPQISVVMGPCAGGACYSPAITDFTFMVQGTSQMYITGPNVVRSVTGEEISAEDLGGAAIHAQRSGVAHFVYQDDLSCLNGVRRLLGYLPQNNEDRSLVVCGTEVDNSYKIPEIVPDDQKRSYDVRDVIRTFVDLNSFLEVQQEFARNIVVGLARLSGKTIGIIANQAASMAGSLTLDASDKAARFIRFCDCFGIPLLTLVDVPAFLPGSQQEHAGIIRHGAKLLYAYSEATVPKVTLIMRKAYGGAFLAMCSKGLGADVVYAWPIVEIAVMGAAGAVSIIGRRAISEADNPSAKKEELLNEYNRRFMNPYIAAEHGFVDEVIRPEETRRRIVTSFEMLTTKVRNERVKRHGNIPL